MHIKKYSALFALLALVLASVPAVAQYDDVYFDASQEEFTYAPYDDEQYDDYDEPAPVRAREHAGTDAASDYEYASRIRRFRRPVGSFGYYDPFYVDAGYYDPFWRSGFNTTLIYNTPAVAYQRVLTPYGTRIVGFNTFGLNRGFGAGFNRWNDPFYGRGFNRGFGYGAGGFGGGFGAFGAGAFGGPAAFGGGGGYYCPPAFGGGVPYNVNNSATALSNRATTSRPRGNTTSIADRITRTNPNYNRTRTSTFDDKSARSTGGRSTATRARNAPTTTRSTSRGGRSINKTRTTVRRPTSTRTRTRSTSPTRTRSTSPSRSTRSRSYTPSRSTRSRSYTPSRSSSTRSYSPSRSSSSRSSSPSRSSSRGRGGR